MLEIIVTKKFEIDLRKIPSDVKIKTDFLLQKLKQNPFSRNLPIKKLKGLEGDFWRLKIDRDYRLVYSIIKKSIILYRIRHRKDIYQKF